MAEGRALVDALRGARDVLRTGATALATAQFELGIAVGSALAAGFSVNEDGTVVAAPLPPAMTTPEGAAAAAEARQARLSELDCQRGGIANTVNAAFAAALRADQDTADALDQIQLPSSMVREVEDLLAVLADPSAALFAGAAAVVRAAQIGLRTKTLLAKFIALTGGNFQTFIYGPADGGVLRYLIGGSGARLVGKAFLPLTVASGLFDVATGGGYDGARGWATRGFGLAGAGGAVGLMAASGWLGTGAATAMIATGPVGLTVAGGAVLAYGAWELGNLVYDHHEAIIDFGQRAAEWTGDAIGTAANVTGDVVNSARDWAGDQISGAASAVGDLGRRILPDIDLPDLNPF